MVRQEKQIVKKNVNYLIHEQNYFNLPILYM